MYFITSRMPQEGSDSSNLPRAVNFNLQDTTASQNVFFCRRDDVNDYMEIGHEAFFNHLKSLADNIQIILFFHGFNNTGEAEVFPRANRLQALLNKHCEKVQTMVIPLIWPCDDDHLVQFADDYWDDQRAADQSAYAFARLLGKFDQWRSQQAQLDDPCTKRISIVAHSMGNRVLQSTFDNWVNNEGNGHMQSLFRHIFMIAADVVNHTLERGALGQYIPDAARNVVVYYANDDLAMPASKLANIRRLKLSRRMGMTGPENLNDTPRNVFEVDCDDFNNSIDKPTGHTYFLDNDINKDIDDPTLIVSPVLLHMAKAIEKARVYPDKRHHKLERPTGL